MDSYVVKFCDTDNDVEVASPQGAYNIVKMSSKFKDNKKLMPIMYKAMANIIIKNKNIPELNVVNGIVELAHAIRYDNIRLDSNNIKVAILSAKFDNLMEDDWWAQQFISQLNNENSNFKIVKEK